MDTKGNTHSRAGSDGGPANSRDGSDGGRVDLCRLLLSGGDSDTSSKHNHNSKHKHKSQTPIVTGPPTTTIPITPTTATSTVSADTTTTSTSTATTDEPSHTPSTLGPPSPNGCNSLWATIGGYDHPHPSSRLMQYGMGWMPDKSINPTVIYANYLNNGKPIPLPWDVAMKMSVFSSTSSSSASSNNSSSSNTGSESELGSGISSIVLANTVITGHQPHGDAPLLIQSLYPPTTSNTTSNNSSAYYNSNSNNTNSNNNNNSNNNAVESEFKYSPNKSVGSRILACDTSYSVNTQWHPESSVVDIDIGSGSIDETSGSNNNTNNNTTDSTDFTPVDPLNSRGHTVCEVLIYTTPTSTPTSTPTGTSDTTDSDTTAPMPAPALMPMPSGTATTNTHNTHTPNPNPNPSTRIVLHGRLSNGYYYQSTIESLHSKDNSSDFNDSRDNCPIGRPIADGWWVKLPLNYYHPTIQCNITPNAHITSHYTQYTHYTHYLLVKSVGYNVLNRVVSSVQLHDMLKE